MPLPNTAPRTALRFMHGDEGRGLVLELGWVHFHLCSLKKEHSSSLQAPWEVIRVFEFQAKSLAWVKARACSQSAMRDTRCLCACNGLLPWDDTAVSFRKPRSPESGESSHQGKHTSNERRLSMRVSDPTAKAVGM